MGEQIAEGKRRAAERRLLLTPEQLELADRASEILLDRFSRLFCGTEQMAQMKGHFPCTVVSHDDLAEFFRREGL